MYNGIFDYLIGYFKLGFFWYTLAGFLLFFVYCALKNYLVNKGRWSILLILFGGYIVTLAGIMLSPWVEPSGLIYPTEWFKASNWQSMAFFTFEPSEWKFGLTLPDSWDEFLSGKLICALLFVPFGFLVPTLWKETKLKVLSIGLLVTAGFEFFQVIVNRTFGLLELVMEYVGLATGFVLFMFLFPLVRLWLYSEKKDGGKK